MSLFQKSVTNKYLKNLDNDKVEKAFENFRKFYGNKLRLANIMQLKEENYQEGFLREVFVQTLGYTINPDENYNLTTEFKNQTDARKADGAIVATSTKGGHTPSAIGVIELKSTKTKNLESIKEQAFGYKNHQPDCKYVITSNFQKLRFYIDNATEYEEFDLFKLDKSGFKLLYLLLSQESIFSGLPEKLKQETKFHESDISNKLYKDYKHFKDKIFENLVKNNPQYDKLTLFKKSQKLLDRFLFVFFAEDSGLIPPNTVSKIIEQWKDLQELDEYKSLYSRFQKLFFHLNKGHIYKKWGEIPAYNGGLFRNDAILDSPKVKIDDKILEKDSLKLSAYDFSSEVDVNILGHIFEHSLNEIEEMEQSLSASFSPDNISKTSKRKKDGVFYTPKYITKYIVENTVGTLCNEKKEKLQINNLLIDGKYRKKDGKINEKAKKLFKTLNDYKNWLLTLKILDPACGSGAFLNQTLDFLIVEHKQIDDLIAELTGENFRLFDTDKAILENNIYGVDINEESVEIAKLSLWLRTAQRGRELSDLSGNIKCGNSLIDKPEVAGDKAFDWNVEFKEIMDNGGFDVVLGNPPYVVSRSISNSEKKFYYKTYKSAIYQINLYLLFIEKSLNLINSTGKVSLIIPNTWLVNRTLSGFRKFITDNFSLLQIIDLTKINVFPDATVLPVIFVAKNGKTSNIIIKEFVNEKYFEKNNLSITELIRENYLINYQNHVYFNQIFDKIEKTSRKLSEFGAISFGVKFYQTGKGKPKQSQEIVKNKIFNHTEAKGNNPKKVLEGKDIERYKINWQGKWIEYGSWLAEPRNPELFEGERILLRRIVNKRFTATYTTGNYCNNSLLHTIKITDKLVLTKYVLVLLNSTLLATYFVRKFAREEKTFPEIRVSEVKTLPIKEISQEKQKPFIEKADLMLSLNKLLHTKAEKFIKRIKSNLEIEKISKKLQNFYDFDFKNFISELKKQKIKLNFKQQDEWEDYFDNYKTDINSLQRKINQTDKEIDKMVYKLYKLTEEEIEIVENSVK